MAITRRGFVKNGALALVGTSTVPAFLQRAGLAQATSAAARQKRLVVIFQRGAGRCVLRSCSPCPAWCVCDRDRRADRWDYLRGPAKDLRQQ